jgi:hypothetical protein
VIFSSTLSQVTPNRPNRNEVKEALIMSLNMSEQTARRRFRYR